jgi:hypothetical protein
MTTTTVNNNFAHLARTNDGLYLKQIEPLDEDIGDIRTTIPAAQVAPSPTEAALPQYAPLQAAPPPSVVTTAPDVISYQGPITRARARELNFVTMLKNDGPEE